MKVLFYCIFLGTLVGCAAMAVKEFDSRYGGADPQRFDNPVSAKEESDWEQVDQVLQKRCVVCHACYDAPCQLKLSSFEGVARGANKTLVYNGKRVTADKPSRLFIDATEPSEWRDRKFFPVLNERENTPHANLAGSVLAQMLLQKKRAPLPNSTVLPDSFDFRLARDQQCPTIEAFDEYQRDYPLWGMPYGLPALPESESKILLDWLEKGAPYAEGVEQSEKLRSEISRWEAFFNQKPNKAQLMSRYIYEHLFLADIWFFDDSKPQFFKLVRSYSAPGEPIKPIATRRPYNSPGETAFYYRLMPVKESISVKTHLPYKFDDARMTLWQSLFLDAEYEVASLPSYDIKTAANPFRAFKAIPVDSRYRFLLDEAQFTIMGFIKGPVCRGQTAVNVINDYFWVGFVDPNRPIHKAEADFINNVLSDVDFPAEENSNASPLDWIAYARQEKEFMQKKSEFVEKNILDDTPLDLNLVWDGSTKLKDELNDNAALTIYRHFDNASVVKGLQGEKPQTAWILTYPLLERIHYLLVSGYDVYGNIGHQLNTRVYMDFLRMEGEFNFLSLLPEEERNAVRAQWYRGSVSKLEKYLLHRYKSIGVDTAVEYQSDDYLRELYAKLQEHVLPAHNKQYDLEQGFNDAETLNILRSVASVGGQSAALLPEVSHIEVVDSKTGERHYYSLLHHLSMENLSHLFGNKSRRLPEEDRLQIVYGLLGAYPGVFMSVEHSDLKNFVHKLSLLKLEGDYKLFLDEFGVRRSDERFWQFSDLLHEDFKQRLPIQAGLLDYNRLENR